MMKPEFSKPFDVAAARAGAPFGCRDGRPAEILKWDGRRAGEPLIGFQGDCDIPASWATDGTYETGCEGDIDLVMLPLGLIDGNPVFVGDEYVGPVGQPLKVEPFQNSFERCTWPAPAKVYPQSTLSPDHLRAEYNSDPGGPVSAAFQRVANAALRHAIDAGQVITSEQAGEEARGLAKVMADRRVERDMAIAKAMRDVCMASVDKFHNRAARELLSVDVAAIIATIE